MSSLERLIEELRERVRGLEEENGRLGRGEEGRVRKRVHLEEMGERGEVRGLEAGGERVIIEEERVDAQEEERVNVLEEERGLEVGEVQVDNDFEVG